MPPAQRLSGVSYSIRRVAVEGRNVEAAGKRVHWLNTGDPIAFGFNTPAHMVEAVLKSLRDGENALLFDADDEAALARQVTRLADDEGLRERLRAAGRATAEAHTAAAHDARVTAILEGLARG